jgi:GNAT superfamily N-acetyltransferase
MANIRLYQASDAQRVSEIIRTTMRRSNAADYPADRLQLLIDYFSPEKVQQINNDRICLVAEIEGKVIATGAVEADDLVTFFVQPEHQGKGIGTALLLELEKIAVALGLKQLRVAASLTGAPFYERHGYKRSGEIIDGTAGPQIPMEKQIG